MTYLNLKRKLEELIAFKNNTSTLIKGDEQEIEKTLLECTREMDKVNKVIALNEMLKTAIKSGTDELNNECLEFISIFKADGIDFDPHLHSLSESSHQVVKKLEILLSNRQIQLELDEIYKYEKIKEKNETCSKLWKEVKVLYDINKLNPNGVKSEPKEDIIIKISKLWKEVKFLYEVDDKTTEKIQEKHPVVLSETSEVEETKENENQKNTEMSTSKVLMELAKLTEGNLTDESKKGGIRRIFGKKQAG